MSDEAPSVDTSGSSELKAGHAPATKVGGMRVGAPRPRHTSHGEDKNTASAQETSEDNAAASDAKEGQTEKTDEGADDDEQATQEVATRAAGQMVGGTFVPIQKAFPTEAVKNIQDRPGTHPKHEAHAYSKQDDQRFMNQPRKQ